MSILPQLLKEKMNVLKSHQPTPQLIKCYGKHLVIFIGNLISNHTVY